VGNAALEGRNRIKKVTRGWRGVKEVNTVYYDSSEITIEEMENALKNAGTYKETIKNE
jgi:hypothetical protein